VLISTRKMAEINRTSDYALGSTDAEHEKLIRQSARIAPLTERFFREAGIGPGYRVLDLGSGVGDVAILAAGLVGPSGADRRPEPRYGKETVSVPGLRPAR
jgi:hypothetical protein